MLEQIQLVQQNLYQKLKINLKLLSLLVLSAEIYNLKILQENIQDDKDNVTRFLLFGKDIFQPDFSDDNHITSILFKLKSKPAALYSALSGFAINGVNMSKLQSFPEKNSFSSYFFLCDIDGHIESKN